jgi:pyruvate dehydrogenase E2 component (dihydrolipoamide acetyltransferase)
MATEVLVPPLGQTADSVTLVAWHKKEGDIVEQGEMLFAIETDKATLDIEAPASGVLYRVSAQPGDEVQVLSAIALIVVPGEVVASRQAGGEEQVAVSSPARERPQKQPRVDGGRIFISPRARRLAEEHNISPAALKPTGPEGAIIERDVRAYLDARSEPAISPVSQDAGLGPSVLQASGPAPGPVVESIPMRGVRAVIAERMARSLATAAHVTFNSEADATALVEQRRQLIRDGVDVSYNALLLRILGRALHDHPRLNASLVEDTIQVWEGVHVGLAVDSDRGLLVPVVRDVDRKGLAQLEGDIRSLVERATAGKSSPEELSGGTFTLTNLGMFGIDSFTPIINPPECAILGVGRIKTRPVFAGDQLVARQTMWLSLSFDHRLVDGAPAARFLQRVVQLIECPYLLFT